VTKDFQYEGFASPNYTPVPDDLFDILAPQLTESELRVLLYVIRRTFGFKRDSDSISLSQLVSGITTKDGRILDRGTGMSRPGVTRGVKGLVEKGIILVDKVLDEKGENQINVYRLRYREGVGNEVNHPSKRSSLPVVNVVNPQETGLQETGLQETDFEFRKEPSNFSGENAQPEQVQELPPAKPLSIEKIRDMTPEERLAHYEAERDRLTRLRGGS
jgi:hypothetical protein